MANAEDTYAKHVKLADSDRELEEGEPDIRGWPVEDRAGNRAGTVDDLLLNPDTELVDAIALDDGEKYPIDDVEIGDEVVYLLSTTPAPETTGDDEEELRVQRSEEELRAGTREREAGGIRVRKKVHTDRESVTVPKRREEVHVDRVPVDEEEGERVAAETEIGDDEVSIPVVEEEVVIEKKPVAKEEVRIRKDVVEDEEVVEEDVRKEEVEVDDDTGRRNG